MVKRTGRNQQKLLEFLNTNGNETYTVKVLAEKLGLTYSITYQSLRSLSKRGALQFENGVVSVGSTPMQPQTTQ